MGIDFKVVNRELLIDRAPRVYLANHQSNWDLFVWTSFVPKRAVSVGKKQIAYIPVFGPLYWLSGNVLLNRTNRVSATKRLNEAAQAIIDRKISLVIFPEGTRSRGRGLLPFKKGAIHTAIEAQVPIQPVCISPYVRDLNYNRWRSGTVTVTVMPPISTEGKHVGDLTTILKEARKVFEEVLGVDYNVVPQPEGQTSA